MALLSSRRSFLRDGSLGFAGVALASLLQRDGYLRAVGTEHHTPRARSVIWIFLSGGYSHLETFDPKPALNKFAGKTFAQAPFAAPARRLNQPGPWGAGVGGTACGTGSGRNFSSNSGLVSTSVRTPWTASWTSASAYFATPAVSPVANARAKLGHEVSNT